MSSQGNAENVGIIVLNEHRAAAEVPTFRPRFAAFVMALLCTFATESALAQAGDRELVLGTHADFVLDSPEGTSNLGFGLRSSLAYGFHPLWSGFGEVGYAHAFSDSGDGDQAHVLVGVGYNLDVLKIVPWARLGFGGRYDTTLARSTNHGFDGLGAAEVGLTWRRRRGWSIGGSAQLQIGLRPEVDMFRALRIGLVFNWIRETDRL